MLKINVVNKRQKQCTRRRAKATNAERVSEMHASHRMKIYFESRHTRWPTEALIHTILNFSLSVRPTISVSVPPGEVLSEKKEESQHSRRLFIKKIRPQYRGTTGYDDRIEYHMNELRPCVGDVLLLTTNDVLLSVKPICA